jgi:hypothetical protein
VSPQDRRRFPRGRATWPAVVESADGRVVSGEVVDVSLSGMQLRTASDAAEGSDVTLRVTLPGQAGRIEVTGRVIRRERSGLSVAFLKLSDVDVQRVAPFVSPGDIRRSSPRVPVTLSIVIQGGSAGTAQGVTVDLSASGSRVITDKTLVPGDVVVLELPASGNAAALRLPAVVWEAYVGGAVLVFANLDQPEFLRLRQYVQHCREHGPQPTSV